MKHLLHALAKSHLVKSDFDHRLIRASMVIIFLLFGYQKWFEYEAQVLIPFISNGPLISWTYPVFGVRGASIFLGVTEWAICLLLFWGFRIRTAGTPRRTWIVRHFRGNGYDHSFHAERLGRGRRRLSSNDQ